MKRKYIDMLNLGPKSTDQLHSVLDEFELKWQRKAQRALGDERISRF